MSYLINNGTFLFCLIVSSGFCLPLWVLFLFQFVSLYLYEVNYYYGVAKQVTSEISDHPECHYSVMLALTLHGCSCIPINVVPSDEQMELMIDHHTCRDSAGSISENSNTPVPDFKMYTTYLSYLD